VGDWWLRKDGRLNLRFSKKKNGKVLAPKSLSLIALQSTAGQWIDGMVSLLSIEKRLTSK